MARHMRRNVILSQGGRHGDKARTYLKGTAPADAAVGMMPDHLVEGVDPQPGKAQATTPRPKPQPMTSILPAKTSPPPTDEEELRAPKSDSALRRWSVGRLRALATQEGIEVGGDVGKAALQDILVAHLKL